MLHWQRTVYSSTYHDGRIPGSYRTCGISGATRSYPACRPPGCDVTAPRDDVTIKGAVTCLDGGAEVGLSAVASRWLRWCRLCWRRHLTTRVRTTAPTTAADDITIATITSGGVTWPEVVCRRLSKVLPVVRTASSVKSNNNKHSARIVSK